MATLKELLAQKEALEQQIAQTKKQERGDAIEQGPRPDGRIWPDRRRSRRQGGGEGRRPSRAAARCAAKYRNASTGESWSGRGLQPRWLKAALASGKKLSDFAV